MAGKVVCSPYGFVCMNYGSTSADTILFCGSSCLVIGTLPHHWPSVVIHDFVNLFQSCPQTLRGVQRSELEAHQIPNKAGWIYPNPCFPRRHGLHLLYLVFHSGQTGRGQHHRLTSNIGALLRHTFLDRDMVANVAESGLFQKRSFT